MGRKREYCAYYMADFETTVYEGQQNTEVWAAAITPIGREDAIVFHTLPELFDYLKKLQQNVVVYYHNLKFDGSFWLNYLLTHGWEQALDQWGTDEMSVTWKPEKKMHHKQLKYSISTKGQWYNLILNWRGYFIEFRDSLKLLPFSVNAIGNSFKTKHRKTEIEYSGYRYAGCDITETEQDYIKNDVYVVSEALKILQDDGHDKITIGSCCMAEYKKYFTDADWNELFPNQYANTTPGWIPADYATVGDYIHKSYRGGWCYLVPGKKSKKLKNGVTLDVNSLYPSMMHSSSGNRYPIGNPYFFQGAVPDIAQDEHHYYFVRIRTRFKLKPGYLPFVQLKGLNMYPGNESLVTSDVLGKDGKYYRYYKNLDGNYVEAKPEIMFCQDEFKLFLEHYDVEDMEILDGCYYNAATGLFDDYINKYYELKRHATGAVRALAKLFLNNLYGKFAANMDSSFKVAYLKPDKSLGFYPVLEFEKTPGYIPIGSAITSASRCFTIRAAQANYYGENKPGFCYADTDSLHIDLPISKIRGVNIHDSDLCCWKLETEWDTGWFVRLKTYIEETRDKNNDIVWDVKCAGMPDYCKALFVKSCGVKLKDFDLEKLKIKTEKERKFVLEQHEMSDFDVGLIVPGKLMPAQIPGGTILTETLFEMRKNVWLGR